MKRILFIIICFMFSPLMATGPGHMTLEILPVSENKMGDVLCKAWITRNPHGYQRLMDRIYTWVVITADNEVEEYPWFTLELFKEEDWERAEQKLNLGKERFKASTDFINPPESLVPIIEKYGFSENNVEFRKREFVLNVEEFFNFFHSARQVTSDGHHSVSEFQELAVIWQFPRFFITRNTHSYKKTTGAAFNYYFPSPVDGEPLGYDLWTIDGILFLEKSR